MTPSVAGGTVAVVMTGSFASTTIWSAWVSVAGVVAESSTPTVKSKVPEAVGVPAISPVDALRLRPPGRLPAAIDQV